MKTVLTVSALAVLILSGCSNKSAGVHINSKGKGGAYIKGGVLKF